MNSCPLNINLGLQLLSARFRWRQGKMVNPRKPFIDHKRTFVTFYISFSVRDVIKTCWIHL